MIGEIVLSLVSDSLEPRGKNLIHLASNKTAALICFLVVSGLCAEMWHHFFTKPKNTKVSGKDFMSVVGIFLYVAGVGALTAIVGDDQIKSTDLVHTVNGVVVAGNSAIKTSISAPSAYKIKIIDSVAKDVNQKVEDANKLISRIDYLKCRCNKFNQGVIKVDHNPAIGEFANTVNSAALSIEDVMFASSGGLSYEFSGALLLVTFAVTVGARSRIAKVNHTARYKKKESRGS